MTRRTLILVAVVLVQLVLVGVAGAAQLSARLTGDDYLFRVEPLDPIDPFRGAYVELDYPDLDLAGDRDLPEGQVYLPLTELDGVWVGGTPVTDRPASGPYLACKNEGWRASCGIQDWFASQAAATRLEDALREGDVMARVRIDGRGHAALMEVIVVPTRTT